MSASVVEIRKNAGETLRLERTQWENLELVGVRVWTGRPGDPEARPTKNGLTLRPATWRQVLEALPALIEEAAKEPANDDR